MNSQAPRRNALAFDPDARFSYRIATLASLLEKQSTRFLAEFGLSIVDWRILQRLKARGAQPLTGLRLGAIVDKALISRRAASLSARRLIKVETDASDSRRRILSLTPAGQALHQAVMPLSVRRQKQLEGLLSESERKLFYGTLAKMTAFVRDDLAPRHERKAA
jgi:DNA-binding MarR family transcriptional regulator